MADLKANNGVLNGDAAHDLSEGYGFIYSLQFTLDSKKFLTVCVSF